MERKLVLVVTHGPEHPEAATIPFALAVAAQTAGVEVVMGFQLEGVRLLVKGAAEKVAAPGFMALKDLMGIYLSNGGILYACAPCTVAHGIKPEEYLEGVKIANAATFVEQFVTATNALVY